MENELEEYGEKRESVYEGCVKKNRKLAYNVEKWLRIDENSIKSIKY